MSWYVKLYKNMPLSHPMASCWLLSVAFAMSMLLANKFLDRYAASNPNSCLKRRNEEGILCMETWTYIVSGFSQAVGYPLLWFFVYTSRSDSDWWFLGEPGWASVSFCGYVIGYYIQDCILSWKEVSTLIIVHHIASIMIVLCSLAASTWRGLFITVGLIYEVGTFAMTLVDLRVTPRQSGPYGMILTTMVGMGMIVHGFVVATPSDAFAWTSAIISLAGGLGRIQQSWAYLTPPSKDKAQ